MVCKVRSKPPGSSPPYPYPWEGKDAKNESGYRIDPPILKKKQQKTKNKPRKANKNKNKNKKQNKNQNHKQKQTPTPKPNAIFPSKSACGIGGGVSSDRSVGRKIRIYVCVYARAPCAMLNVNVNVKGINARWMVRDGEGCRVRG